MATVGVKGLKLQSSIWASLISIDMLLFCLELPPQQGAQRTSVPHESSSHDASVFDIAPPSNDSVPSSPTVQRPPVSPAGCETGPSGLQAVALYDFNGDTSLGDLAFHAGETIDDVRSLSAEWMSGRIGDRTGNFPTAFVQISSS